MMLDSVGAGDAIGIPVPIGYTDVMDVEKWPMLQAFALDSVYTATGRGCMQASSLTFADTRFASFVGSRPISTPYLPPATAPATASGRCFKCVFLPQASSPGGTAWWT